MSGQAGATDTTTMALSRLCDGVRDGAPGARSALDAPPFGGTADSDNAQQFELRHPIFESAHLLTPTPDAETATIRLVVRDNATMTLGDLEAELGASKALPMPPINPGTGGVAPAFGGRVAFLPKASDDGRTLCTVHAEVADRTPDASSAVIAVTVDGGRLD